MSNYSSSNTPRVVCTGRPRRITRSHEQLQLSVYTTMQKSNNATTYDIQVSAILGRLLADPLVKHEVDTYINWEPNDEAYCNDI